MSRSEMFTWERAERFPVHVSTAICLILSRVFNLHESTAYTVLTQLEFNSVPTGRPACGRPQSANCTHKSPALLQQLKGYHTPGGVDINSIHFTVSVYYVTLGNTNV